MANRKDFDPLDIIGKRFGKLVIERFHRQEPPRRRRGPRRYFYVCKCDCGASVEGLRANLITGHTTSCGCRRLAAGNKSQFWTGFGEISGRHWSQINRHAIARGLPFEITIEDAWDQFKSQNGKCALTGLQLSLTTHHSNYKEKTASLDRIDNTSGYVNGNIHWLHKDVNWMKGRFSQDYFIEVCCAVASQRCRDK